MKLTKSRLKQIIKEELEGPRTPEAGSFTTAHGLKIVGPMGCDTRVTREGGKRDECLECVSKGKAYYPRMPAGQRCQERYWTPDAPERSTEPAEQFEESRDIKITKSQLKQMIEEELNDVKEGWNPFEKSPEKKAQKAMRGAEASLQQFASYDKPQDPTVADSHTAAIDSLEDYIANHYPSDDALRELVENVQDLVAEFEDDMQDKLAGAGSSGLAPREI